MAALAVAILGLSMFSGTAAAIKLHPSPPAEFFGADGTAATSFEQARSLGIQQAAKKLYVLDRNANKIYGFDISVPGSQVPLAGFDPFVAPDLGLSGSEPRLAVDSSNSPSAGNVYFFTRGKEGTSVAYGLNSSGDSLPGWPLTTTEFTGVAVDPSGNVWLAEEGAIKQYSPTGVALNSISTPNQAFSQLDFDSNGDLYGFTQFGLWKLSAPSYLEQTELVNLEAGQLDGLAVDRTDHTIYVTGNGSILRFSTDGTLLEEFGSGMLNGKPLSVAVNGERSDVYVATESRVYLFGASTFPFPITGGATSTSNSAATLDGTVNPEGVPLTDCHVEYVTQAAFAATGFSDLTSGGSAPCDPPFSSIPADSANHAVSGLASGLSPSTAYRFRLVAANANGEYAGKAGSFTLGQPLLETVGSPVRAATTARLDSRVYPHGIATAYHFEYGEQGPCDSNMCTVTASHSAGSSDTIQLVSQSITGLKPGTTYHYRVVADNGNVGGPAFGADKTLTTRASDAPLSHGALAGPPGSDRAWEQVNTPDTGGNPVRGATAISDDGTRALYQIAGGSPLSEAGSLFNQLFAGRTGRGWQSQKVYPTRLQALGNIWLFPSGRDDLSELIATNFSNGAGSEKSEVGAWRLTPGTPSSKVFGIEQANWGQFSITADDGSRILTTLRGTQDPTHPVLAKDQHLYDVTSGAPRLIDLLPGGSLSCLNKANVSAWQLPGPFDIRRATHWVSGDGSRAFFPSEPNTSDCSGPTQLYMRNLGDETTTRISAVSISGPECPAQFVRSTADAAFFWSQGRLAAEDSVPATCLSSAGIPSSSANDGDVYRYGFSDGVLSCVTCVGAGIADVASAVLPQMRIAVADNGSRVYFEATGQLVPGAATPGIYRVDVASGDLAYVAAGGGSGGVGDVGKSNQAISPDGSVVVFTSSSGQVNALNGSQNGGTRQYYRYDDSDRSLVCVSCPPGGAAPTGPVPSGLISIQELGPNLSPIDDAGDLVFSTPSSLITPDQNTARTGQNPVVGMDVYEWRDGRPLLVTDGLTGTPAGGSAADLFPKVSGITPDGRSIFFTQAAALTPDALDGYPRLYNARVGGGFEFPTPPQPCALEVCQGTPKGAPEEAPPGSASFLGPSNPKPRFAKKKHKAKHHKAKRHHKKHAKHRTNHDRRTSR